MKHPETNLADSGMTSLEFIFSKVSMVTSRYTRFDSRQSILSRVKTVSLVRSRWTKPICLASPFVKRTNGTTNSEGRDESTRTLSLAERGKTVESPFRTGEIVSFGRVPKVETD